MPTPSDAHLRGLLAQAEHDFVEAEQRRGHQARVVSDLLAGTEARTYAEKVLREIDRTIAFNSANRALVQHILA